MALFGAAAIILPPFASLIVAILFGWLLVASGLVGLFITLMVRPVPGFWWSLLSALVTLLAGAFLFFLPYGGLVSLSLALAAYLLLDGLLAIAMAFDHRRHLTPKWTWLLLNGIVDIVFAGIIVWWMPTADVYLVGFIVGIDMLMSGATQIAMALDARKA